ncbi:tryptophan synthase, alpha chain [Lachnospiraceae bacterium RM5]|nr:tryptophan synthase, alpha chain [Lachnospiraceae bacterium RM5]
MSRISDRLKNKKNFIGFLTAGDPCMDKTKEFVLEMVNAGADLVEIGIPFSDPIAEGEVIQNANVRALNAGANLSKLFDCIVEIRKETDIPLVFLTYANPVFKYGYENFMKKCNEIGIDGLIIPDIPYEEKGEILDVAKKYDVDIISMIAPTSKERIQMIAKDSTGFLYVVSSLGVTGMRSNINTNLEEIVDSIRKVTDTPLCIGFGINNEEQAKHFSEFADGVIVGSAIVKIIEKYGEDSGKHIYEYVEKMKKAVE